MDRDYWINRPSHYEKTYWDRHYLAHDSYWLTADEDECGWFVNWYL